MSATDQDVYRLICAFLEDKGHKRTKKALIKEAGTIEVSEHVPELMDVYNEYLKSRERKEGSVNTDSDDHPESDTPTIDEPVKEKKMKKKKKGSKKAKKSKKEKGKVEKKRKRGDTEAGDAGEAPHSEEAPAETAADDEPVHKGGKRRKKKSEPSAERFRRVKDEDWSSFKDNRLADNSYTGTFGDGGWGRKAEDVLGRVRGKNFRHEKTKKKRGSYKGGQIDAYRVNSIKFT